MLKLPIVQQVASCPLSGCAPNHRHRRRRRSRVTPTATSGHATVEGLVALRGGSSTQASLKTERWPAMTGLDQARSI